MAGKILGIEIGSKVTRIVEMDSKKVNPKIYNYCYFETAEGVMEDGDVKNTEEFAMALKTMLREKKIHTNRVVFCVNSGRVAVREVKIPFVKPKRIRSMILANASEYFPVDLSEYELGIRVMDIIEEEGRKKYQLTLMALPREIVEDYRKLAASAGLILEGLDYAGNSMVQAIRNRKTEGLCAYVKVSENSSMVVICQDNKVKLQRTVKYGIEGAVELLRSYGKSESTRTWLQALAMARSQNCVNSSFQEMKTQEGEGEGLTWQQKQEVTEQLEPVIGNIERILIYYTSQNDNQPLEHVYLLGIGASICGIGTLMENELRYPVMPLDTVQNLGMIQQKNGETFYMVEFITCIQAVAAPSFRGDIIGAAGKKKSGHIEKRGSMALAVCVFGVLSAAALLLAVYPFVQKSQYQAREKELKAQIEAYEYLRLEYESYQQAKSELGELNRMLDGTRSHTEYLVSFIQEMEEKMPTEISTMTLTADDMGVTMSFTVKSKSAAAKVLQQLRTFTSIAVEPSTSGITDTIGDVGQHIVQFSVSCTYLTGEKGELR